MDLYGKDAAVRQISSMIGRDRLPHAFMFFGEKGVGKKTLARYVAQLILCQEHGNVPCGHCIPCRKIEKNIHPDFIQMIPGGKNGNYLSEELRGIVSDAAVAPNESEKKIYFLPDIDRSLPEAQNMLLKVVEEPPQHVMFLMTAESKEKILPTILSRVISIGITAPSPEDCLKALSDFGKDRDMSQKAVAIFGGNIGRCLEYIENGGRLDYLDSVESIVGAMIKRDEFLICSSLCAADVRNDRGRILDVLAALKDVMRDISAQKLGTALCSVDQKGAMELAKTVRQSGVERIYEAISLCEKRIGGNASVPLVLSKLAADIAVNI